MKQYIGTKIIEAEPAKRFWMRDGRKIVVSLNEVISHQMLKDAAACDDGYKVRYADGYESFSPKDVFEAAYRETHGGISFGLAIEAVKLGKKIARKGWNGKDMYIFLASEDICFTTGADMSEFLEESVEVHPMLVLRTAEKTLQPGWLAS